ncbi:hypothetical protein [Rossellomorea sp. DA94]|uniref:hypothetical protein n=1 Tax=Rossellomorea sp. DA94 TaxID=3038653 RepID=UPI00244687AE|nr:hypothetical protein [Rossellomorea sp. DA94]WGG45407.1 hypothetical protein P8596_22315 [Rossellomorea sp. DA94]
MAVNIKKCPACGSINTVRIIYGEPANTYSLGKGEEFKLGGCCTLVDGPELYCKQCEHQWNKEEAIQTEYSKISRLKASVGGFFGSSYTIDIQLDDLQLLWEVTGDVEERKEKSLRRKTADNLKAELRMLDLLNWKAKYVEPGVLDGTHWRVEIQLGDRKVVKQGDNRFPKEWTEFCRVMRRVSGRRFS